DSFIFNSAGGVADNIDVALKNGDQIAASGSDKHEEESNNENVKKLIAIKDETLIGKATLTEAYASLVSSVGSTVNTLKSNGKAAASVYDNLELQQQSVSGVDPNEEFVKMNMFTQYYQANAQVLQTAITIFDTLLSVR
ncbi:flagellar basal body rod C-terminal domain-containing protein, partial [Mixta calida]